VTGVFEIAGRDVGALVEEKNAAYGNSYDASAKIMGILYPDGIRPDQYRDALGVVRVIDKLCRLAHSPDAFGENPWADIAGYGLRGMVGPIDRPGLSNAKPITGGSE